MRQAPATGALLSLGRRSRVRALREAPLATADGISRCSMRSAWAIAQHRGCGCDMIRAVISSRRRTCRIRRAPPIRRQSSALMMRKRRLSPCSWSDDLTLVLATQWTARRAQQRSLGQAGSIRDQPVPFVGLARAPPTLLRLSDVMPKLRRKAGATRSSLASRCSG